MLSEPFFFILGQPVRGVVLVMPDYLVRDKLSPSMDSLIDICYSLIVLRPWDSATLK